MKNKLFLLIMLFVTGSLFISCSDRLEEEFYNPERHNPKPEEIVPGMLTNMITSRFYELDYGEWWWTFRSGYGIPLYAQICMRRPMASDASAYTNWDNIGANNGFYNGMQSCSRFNQYYVDLRNWGLMRDLLEELSGDELIDNEPFFLAASILKCAIGLQTVDLFNSIPYSEAFLGTKGVFFPKYDKPNDVYNTILDELADLSANFVSAHTRMSQTAKELFARNDIALKGDPQKWAQYANAVRLRHAVRMSGVEPENAVRHIVSAIANLPNEDFIYPITRTNDNRIGNEGGGIYSRSIFENSSHTQLPNIMVYRMNHGSLDYEEGEDDPRLPPIATPTRYTREDPENYQFQGVSGDLVAQHPYWPSNTVNNPGDGTIVNVGGSNFIDNGQGITFRTFQTNPSNITQWLRGCYSQYNIATFQFGNIPSYFNSLAENDLFLAEIAAKGLASTGKSAAEHIKDAVIHSTHFWYYINSLTNIWVTPNASGGDVVEKDDYYQKVFEPTKPSDAIIEQYANKVRGFFEEASDIEDQMEIIMQQKYIHHNILNIYELWAELRRTRHPKIEKWRANLDDIHEPMPERIKYPASEEQNNPDNYYEVNNEDNFTTPIFWVPQNKRGQSYYMEGYLPLRGFLELPDPNPNRPPP